MFLPPITQELSEEFERLPWAFILKQSQEMLIFIFIQVYSVFSCFLHIFCFVFVGPQTRLERWFVEKKESRSPVRERASETNKTLPRSHLLTSKSELDVFARCLYKLPHWKHSEALMSPLNYLHLDKTVSFITVT